jgi:hypothetical protein
MQMRDSYEHAPANFVWKRRIVSISSIVLLELLLVGCAGGSRPPECPKTLVKVDPRSQALPALGTYGDAATCSQYCDTDRPVCRRTKDDELTCQAGCG